MPSLPSACGLRAVVAVLCTVPLASVASAQGPAIAELQSNPAVRAAVSACMGDHARLCSGVTPGGGRIVRCLAEHSAALSPGCRAAMEKASSALMAAGVALMPDRPVK